MSKSRREHGRLPPLHLPLRTLATSNTLSPAFGFGTSDIIKMNSPMSNLAINLSELSTGRGTPRRKLSLSSTDTPSSSCHPTPERMSSTESGCFVDSPTPLDSPTLEMSMHRFAKNIKPDIPPEAFTKKKTIAFRRIQSMPLPMMRLSPIDFNCDMDKENEKQTLTFGDPESDHSSESFDTSTVDQEVNRLIRPKFFSDENSSQDSGVDLERDGRDEFQFAAPIGVPPRNKMKIINEDTCSPLKYSPVKYLTDSNSNSPSRPRSKSVPVTGLDFSGANIRPIEESDSPLKFNRLLSHDDEDVDDGFLDCMDSEIAQINENGPSVSGTMASLFSAPVVNEDHLASKSELEEDDTPLIKRSNRRYLNRSQSYDVRNRLNSNKRDPPADDSTPTQSKRRRSILSSSSPELADEASKTPPKPKLFRCQSETEAVIKSALNRIANEPDLIGDCSKPYCLPTIPGKHQDLKGISPETMVDVLNNKYDNDLEKYIVVDCRYPYEFDGGHIKDAKNIYTKEGILEEFIKRPITADSSNKRVVLIFHCEFSSERGPSLLRFLRKMDRDVNKECYPALHYPELYLLEGGYKVFYQDCKDHCEPRSYKPMLHKDHTNDYRHFRAKSKSWAGEKAGRTGFRPLKF